VVSLSTRSDGDAAKQAAARRIDEARDQTVSLSQRIHGSPEVGYEEEQAAAWLCEALAQVDFDVETQFCGLPTAFRARFGSGPLNVALLAEYDALPNIGHACGHNMIAGASFGAATALAAMADDLGLTVTVLGTPAEETLSRGGKIVMLERGGFDGIHAAMMVHPTPFEVVAPPTLAALAMHIDARGRPAHASAAPEQGRNAADALTVAQVALGLLRQHMTTDARISGFVSSAGEAANIIPASASAEYVLRAASLSGLVPLRERVEDCFRAGGIATGCEVTVTGGERPYAELVSDPVLADLYRANALAAGRVFTDPSVVGRFMPSTDVGNVSQVIPTIHPYLGLDSWPVVNHQAEFAAACATPAADDLTVLGARLLASVAIDMATSPALRQRLLQPRTDPRPNGPKASPAANGER
jgi:amidohydrolase